MKLWLVSFLILFVGAEGIQWFVHLHWFSGVELSVPAIAIGGIGLAVVSNYRQLQALGLLPEFFPPSDLDPSGNPQAAPLSPPAVNPGPPAAAKDAGKKQSISFEIPKPKPVSFEIRKPGNRE
jgi:hypothetical protein